MKAIYMILEGRLGNNLWEVAAAATLAKRLDVPYFVVPNKGYMCPEPDNCPFTEYIAPYRDTIFQKIQFIDEAPNGAKYLCEPNLTTINEVPEEGVLIEGYFQNYRLIDESIIHELFAPSQTLVSELKAKYPILNKTNTCSIVVRRGDYVNLPMQFPVEDMVFYEKCMNKLQRTTRNDDMHYICISDDPDWCKRHFVGENFTIVQDEPPLIDLYLASLCKHNIISNSSFAVWGAMLNTNPDKQVYYPTPWLGIGMRRCDNTKTGLPNSWNRVKHFSKAYKHGLWLWFVGGIQKRVKAILKR